MLVYHAERNVFALTTTTDEKRRKAESMKHDSTRMIICESSLKFSLIHFLSTLAIRLWLHNPQVKMDRITLLIEVTPDISRLGLQRNNDN